MRIKNTDIALATSIGISVVSLFVAKKIRDRRIENFRARVIGYHIDDLHTEYDDETGRTMNYTELFILTPHRFKRRIIHVFHPINSEISPVWRRVGAEIEFMMTPKVILKAMTGKIKIMSEDMNLN